MAKKNWANGDIVTPDFMNTHYQTGGGHKHDGGPDDGDAAKIDLTLEVDGELPVANMAEVKNIVLNHLIN